MLIDGIDHIVVPVADLEAAAAAFTRLGLNLTPALRHAGQGTENRAFFVGDGTNDFYVELLGIHDREAAQSAGRALYVESLDRGGGLARIMLRTSDIHGAVAELGTKGVATAVQEVRAEDGRKICDVAPIEGVPGLVANLGLVQYPETVAEGHARRAAAGRFDHRFSLKRLDHLAAFAADLDGSTGRWADLLSVPLHGEVTTPVILIRQLKMGDAIFELLGPSRPDSPAAGRPPGVASMCAFEVSDLAAAVTLARERGFTVSEPGPGALPGTRTATIAAGELAGLALQLLEYV
jgi:catechol 2,3-dioxygenase-like lactoylglutathione lyase family enzyme